MSTTTQPSMDNNYTEIGDKSVNHKSEKKLKFSDCIVFYLSFISIISILFQTLLALLLPTSPYSTLLLLTLPNPSLNYLYKNQSNCIILSL